MTSFLCVGQLPGEIAEIAAAGVEFGGENADQGKTRPLAEAKASEELLPGVLQGGLYAVKGGQSHEHLTQGQGIVERRNESMTWERLLVAQGFDRIEIRGPGRGNHGAQHSHDEQHRGRDHQGEE